MQLIVYDVTWGSATFAASVQHEYDIKHQHKVSKTENRLSLKHTQKNPC